MDETTTARDTPPSGIDGSSASAGAGVIPPQGISGPGLGAPGPANPDGAPVVP